jgi:hypothetical protein
MVEKDRLCLVWFGDDVRTFTAVIILLQAKRSAMAAGVTLIIHAAMPQIFFNDSIVSGLEAARSKVTEQKPQTAGQSSL